MNHNVDLSPEVVTRVREAVDVVEVMEEHVRLKRKGRRYEGLCPFHEEKTPSFSVDPDKGLYHCFGCHAGGDIISFVMQLESLDFPEAVEKLARRYGVQLPAKSPEQRRRRNQAERIRTVLEEAQHWFVERLHASDGAHARSELERRGFDDKLCREFGFGYAPDAWRELLSDLSRRHPVGAIIQAGLAVESESGRGPYDRFRKRLTFPIRATDGRLVAFGGRILGDGEPKYLNSPESVIFAKRNTLFCLDRARRAISDKSTAIVVEGYFDCLSLHKVGITWSVATLGTALTADHARVLRRLVGPEGQVILCYDADEAGQRAAESGARVLLEATVEVKIVVMEGGKDPDDIIRDHGVEAMTALVERPMPILKYLLRDLPSNPALRRREGIKLSTMVCAARDPALRANLIEELARELDLRPHDIEEHGRHPQRRRHETAKVRESAAPGEIYLARILLESGRRWRRRVVEIIDDQEIRDARVRAVFEGVETMTAIESESEEDLDVAALCEALDPGARSLVAEIVNSELPEITDKTIVQQLKILLDRQARQKARRLLPLIEAAEQRGDVDEVKRLLVEKARVRRDVPSLGLEP